VNVVLGYRMSPASHEIRIKHMVAVFYNALEQVGKCPRETRTLDREHYGDVQPSGGEAFEMFHFSNSV